MPRESHNRNGNPTVRSAKLAVGNSKMVKPRRDRQLALFKGPSLAYGGTLLNTRKGRSHGRTISTKDSMHLVLRSSKAIGAWSFRAPKNKKAILQIISKFAKKYSVQIKSMANVGNHLHLHVQLARRDSYRPFIRAITGAIAMAVTGVNRWQGLPKVKIELADKIQTTNGVTNSQLREFGDRAKELQPKRKLKFWDYRPFTRVVRGYRAMLRLKDYIQINFWESQGISREEARTRINWRLSSA